MADLGQIADVYDSVKAFVGLRKKKKRYYGPSQSTLIGDYNKKSNPLRSKHSFFVPVQSAKFLKSKVKNGKRI